MSTDEQDAILGKTVREKIDAKRNLATADKRLRDVADDLRSLANDLLRGADEGQTPPFSFPAWMNYRDTPTYRASKTWSTRDAKLLKDFRA